jgi:uncharacterized protein
MSKPILFIQGGGEGAYEEDEKLASSLQAELGDDYQVHYPKMPDEDNPNDEAWKGQIAKELDALSGSIILVGHSLGGALLMKYLSEVQVKQPVAGIFLIAAPFVGAPGWEFEETALPENVASKLPKAPIFLYHSRGDEWVPFEHMALYAEKLPGASVHEFDGRGHQFNNDLSEVAADIIRLGKS